MIKVGYEDFPSGGSTQYWKVGTAISAFEAYTKKSIQEIVAENYPGKTVSQIVRESGSIDYGEYWIDFSEFSESSLEKEIAEAKQAIDSLTQNNYLHSSLIGHQIMLKDLEDQLKLLRNELPDDTQVKKSQASENILENVNDVVATKINQLNESRFTRLVFDETYKPDKKTIASANVLASFGYDWAFGSEQMLSKDEITIKRVLSAGDEDYSNLNVLFLEYYCWVCPDNFSNILKDPNMLRKWGTKVLIEKEDLVMSERVLCDLIQFDQVNWIEAESIDGDDLHIGTDDIPECVIDTYISYIENNIEEVGEYYHEYYEDEEYVSQIDSRIREVFQRALDKYIAENEE